ncbi:MAG: CRISPR-associated helicase Cas3' [Candidatus Sericytochromatia bacterium]
MTSQTYPKLLAKGKNPSGNPRPGETLTGHTNMVIVAFKSMFGESQSPTRLALAWLNFFKLTQDAFDSFWLHVLVACALHDIGKANEDFQKMVYYQGKDQLLRHEHLSGLLMYCPSAREWLETIDGLDFWVTFAAVVGHHLKVKDEDFARPKNTLRSNVRVYPQGIQSIFKLLAFHLGLQAPTLALPEFWTTKQAKTKNTASITEMKEEIEEEIYTFEKGLRKNTEKSSFLNAVRAALILSDSAGSGLSRVQDEAHLAQAIHKWLTEVFTDANLQTDLSIESHIIQPRIQQIEAQGKLFKWDSFQTAAAHLPERALLLAPCGSGKTLAAWKWIGARLQKQPRSRVIFLYPTRATATEGFRDYVAWAPEADAALVHGTAAYELNELFENPDDDRKEKDFTTEDRLYAIGYWPKRVFSATVDQFLGFMQYAYASVCLLPLLVDSVVVVDEVHSFDQGMFSALKKFLENFSIPVLCMTASLPENRQKQLVDCGLQIFPESLVEFNDLRQRAELPRYRIKTLPDQETALTIARQGLHEGKRVLWVVNTVDECQRLARQLNAICYHSRFKLDDRKRAHQQVIAKFQQQGQAVIALTTQVCEMSLDLDAEILITELAPIPSLIQRLGRCNRHKKSDDGCLGQVYVYTPSQILPYRKEELAAAENFLQALLQHPASQHDLERGLMEHDKRPPEMERYSAFLQSGVWAFSADHHFRDSLDLSAQAILDKDLENFLHLKRNKAPTDGLILPAPYKLTESHPKLERFYLKIVRSKNYSPVYGLLKSLEV